jgi:uncharacterized protein (TIGR03000 family)
MKLETEMKFFGDTTFHRLKTFCCAIALVSLAGLIAPNNGWADSWGSGGSWGGSSGGSWGGGLGSSGGGGGLFGGQRPLRNLFGRIGDRLHGGSKGGSSGFAYSSQGSNGSTGFSYASSGGGLGSMGSSYGSMSSSYGSTGFGYGSSGVSYGSYGSVGGSSGGSIVSAPMTYYPGAAGAYGPAIYDPGYAPAITNPGSDTFQPVPGVNYEGGTGNPATAPTPGSQRESDFQAPASPERRDGSTSLMPSRTTVLNLKVPSDAQVYINDHKTRTTGENRRYVSKNLDPTREYSYHIKAVVVRDGKELVRNEVVNLKAGNSELVEFNFDKAITSLALSVPENARVTLCGKVTNASGASRHFSTTKLEPGQTWDDYTVEVVVEKNGQVIRQEKKLQLVGGENYNLKFELDETGEMLAVR